MWVVMRLQPFEFEPKNLSGLEVRFDAGRMIGYLPVYQSKEDAGADYPGAVLMEAQESSNA